MNVQENKISSGHTDRNGRIVATLTVALIMVTGLAFYFWSQTGFSISGAKPNNEGQSENEIKKTIEMVGKLIVLPDDEEPTIATVSDPDKLAGQPFFELAKTGDKVIIYSKSKKAILYDPVANKIVNVAPINIGDGAGFNTQTSPNPNN